MAVKLCPCGKPVAAERRKYCSKRCMDYTVGKAWRVRRRAKWNAYVREHRQKNLERYRAQARARYRADQQR